MLKKLLKYDLKSMVRLLVPLSLAVNFCWDRLVAWTGFVDGFFWG